MPVSKKPFEQAALVNLHARVRLASGFGPKDLTPDDNRARVTAMLKILESRGLVLHVDGWGWVDSHTAIDRYNEYSGLLANQTNRRDFDEDGRIDIRKDLTREDKERADAEIPSEVCTSRYNGQRADGHAYGEVDGIGSCECPDEVNSLEYDNNGRPQLKKRGEFRDQPF